MDAVTLDTVLPWVVGALVLLAIGIWVWIAFRARAERLDAEQRRRDLNEHNARVRTNREAIRRELSKPNPAGLSQISTAPPIERRKYGQPRPASDDTASQHALYAVPAPDSYGSSCSDSASSSSDSSSSCSSD
jgi:cytoskeletal protein RodZ